MEHATIYLILAIVAAVIFLAATVNVQVPKAKPWNLVALGLLVLTVIWIIQFCYQR